MMESCGITQILCLNLNSVPCPLCNPGQVTKSVSLNIKPPRPFDDFSLIKEVRVLSHEDIGKQCHVTKVSWLFFSVLSMEISRSICRKKERNKERVMQKESLFLKKKSDWTILK